MVEVREVGETERTYWNTEIQRFTLAHPLNAFEWGMVRSVDGWKPFYLCAERDGLFCGGLLILCKKLPYTPFSILYAQKMPVWDYDDDETLTALVAAAKAVGHRENAIFLRMNPNIPEQFMEGRNDKLVERGFRRLKQRWSLWNSPRDMARIDLTVFDTPEEYLSRLPKNTRASVRKAERKGVTLEPATTKGELRQFYQMFRDFSIEKSFMVRDYAYQEKLWDTYISQGMGRVLLAKYEGKVVGGCLDLMFAGKCLGMHGGSLQQYRTLRIDDAFNVQAIMWAKENGCSWYSFRGLGSRPTQGYYKRKFLTNVVPLVGYYDYPFKKVLYRLFYWTEFTFLPLSWPVIIRVRNLWNGLRKEVSGQAGEGAGS